MSLRNCQWIGARGKAAETPAPLSCPGCSTGHMRASCINEQREVGQGEKNSVTCRRSGVASTCSPRFVLRLSLLFLCSTAPASAHAPVPGFEGFYVGLLDPLSAVPQIVLLLALGLMIGGFENRRLIWLLSVFLLANLTGIALGAGFPRIEPALLGAASVCGAVAALASGRWFGCAVVVTTVAGLLIGAVSIPDPGPMGDRIITVFGSFVGASVVPIYLAGGVLFFREKYPGAWATALLRAASTLVCLVATAVLALRLGSGV